MKLLILAAGYATRLYPLTKNKAKPLLEIAGRPMIEHILATTENIKAVDEILIVSNERFAGDFQSWAKLYRKKRRGCPPVTIVNDQSTDESNRLGAIGDIQLAIRTRKINDDLLIIGGDNLFNQSLEGFSAFAAKHGPTLGVYDIGDLALMTHYGNVFAGPDGRISRFEEKPGKPSTTLAAMCLYYYPRQTLPVVHQYLSEGNNPDQPGHLIGWLYTRQPVYAYQIRGKWLDIGDFESLEQANRQFS
jgi:glucose-1-phosphate thymidylyltransferase